MRAKKDLKHYGVLGMKWGKRKGRSDESRSTLKSKWTSTRKLSNKQIQSANKRMRLEKDFKKLKSVDLSGAKKVLDAALKLVGSITITTVVGHKTGAFDAAQKLLGRG